VQHRAVIAAVGLLLACAAPPTADSASATAWGYVKLIPKPGLPAAESGYSDRRLHGVQRFDYSHPSFAVVFAPNAPAPPPSARELAIEAGPNGARWSAPVSAIGVNDRLQVANRTEAAQVISAPQLAWLRELAPGEAAELTPSAPGELRLHSLGSSAQSALVWVAPGAFTLASAAGRYELRELPPGVIDLRAWHPRLPEAAAPNRTIEAGAVVRIDLEIGVEQAAGREP